jgi:hypothetical protein
MQLQIKQITGLAAALKAPFEVSATAPLNPVANHVWLEPTSLALYVYLVSETSSAWVQID